MKTIKVFLNSLIFNIVLIYAISFVLWIIGMLKVNAYGHFLGLQEFERAEQLWYWRNVPHYVILALMGTMFLLMPILIALILFELKYNKHSIKSTKYRNAQSLINIFKARRKFIALTSFLFCTSAYIFSAAMALQGNPPRRYGENSRVMLEISDTLFVVGLKTSFLFLCVLVALLIVQILIYYRRKTKIDYD